MTLRRQLSDEGRKLFVQNIIMDQVASSQAVKKYPSTPHFPFSPEIHDDDSAVSVASLQPFLARDDIVITEKMDGANCCLGPGGKVYARTHGHEATHASFNAVKVCGQRSAHKHCVYSYLN